MMKKLLLMMASACIATGTFAEGYQVNNLSARQSGMGHTGVAMQLNSESIYFNPAATAFQSTQFDFSAGFAGISSKARFLPQPTVANGYNAGAAQETDNKLSTPLYVYANYKPTERLAVGVGFYTPYGSAVNWGDDWSGAHLVQNIKLTSFTVQPTVAWKITDRLSVGAGLMVTWGNFELSRSMLSPASRAALIAGKLDPAIAQIEAALPMLPEAQQGAMAAQLAELQGARDYLGQTMNRSLVSATLEGKSDVAFGVNAGLLWEINDRWSAAVSYRSRMMMKVARGQASMNIDPTAAVLIAKLAELAPDTDLLPPLDQGTFHSKLPLPSVVTAGVSFRPTPRWELAVDLQWNGWSAYKTLNVEFNETELGIKPICSVKNYSNTMAFRFGGQYEATDWLTARMGMYVDQSPVSSDYLNPETPSLTKVGYTAGLSLRPVKWMSVDLAYCYVTTADPERTGSYPIYNYYSEALEEVFAGNYKLKASVFSVGLGFRF